MKKDDKKILKYISKLKRGASWRQIHDHSGVDCYWAENHAVTHLLNSGHIESFRDDNDASGVIDINPDSLKFRATNSNRIPEIITVKEK